MVAQAYVQTARGRAASKTLGAELAVPGAEGVRELLGWLDGVAVQPGSDSPTVPTTNKNKGAPVYADMVGLQSRPELNGKRVEVLRYVQIKGRYAVRWV